MARSLLVRGFHRLVDQRHMPSGERAEPAVAHDFLHSEHRRN